MEGDPQIWWEPTWAAAASCHPRYCQDQDEDGEQDDDKADGKEDADEERKSERDQDEKSKDEDKKAMEVSIDKVN